MIFRKATTEDIPAIAEIYDDIHTEEEAGRTSVGWIRGVYPTGKTAEAAVLRGDLFVAEENGIITGTAIINQQQVDVYEGADWQYAAKDEDVMVLPHHVVSLGGGDDDDPVVGSQGEVGGADEVPDVLDEDDVVVVQVDVREGLLDEVGVQVALVSGVAVDRVQSGLLEPGVVVHAGDVTRDSADADTLGPELLGELDDEGGLPCSDGSHEVDGFDPLAPHEAVVLMGDLVVLLENIDFHAGLYYVHGRRKPVHTI